jgi:hypothetical protein
MLQFQNQVTFIFALLFLTVFSLFRYSATTSLRKRKSQLSRNQFYEQSDEMPRKLAILIVLVLAVLNWSTETAGQDGLEANLAGARLPTTLYRSSAVYDGVDFVYIF